MRAKLTLKARAIQWLSQREHSRAELRVKLLLQLRKEAHQARQAGLPLGGSRSAEGLTRQQAAATGQHDDTGPADSSAVDFQAVDAMLDELTQKGYLSEQRFIESRLRLRAPKLGLRRIEAELSQHKVALDASQSKALSESEYSRALSAWRRKFGGAMATEPKERMKHMRFLAARGFDAEVIRRVVLKGEDDTA